MSTSVAIRDLLRSFEVQRPPRVLSPPCWDLNIVLGALRSPPYEPLATADFRSLTKKCLFLVALATAKRVGELQALSPKVTRVGGDMSLSYSPTFVAKTESSSNPIPRAFTLQSLRDFVGNMTQECLLCPVRALSYYLDRTRNVHPRPKTLFVSPRNNLRSMSNNAISYFLRETISGAGAVGVDRGRTPRAHSIRGVSTYVAFHRNWFVKQVLEAATWKCNSVFVSFYLKDVTYVLDGCSSLGPFVAAGQVINASPPV